MKRADLTEKLLDIKREKGWSWKYICEQIGGMSPVLIVGALLGQMKLTKPQAANAGQAVRPVEEPSRRCSTRCRCAAPARRCRRPIR